MKIAFYITTILEQGGGSQEYFITTAKKIAEKYGHDVDIIGLDDKFTVTYLRFFLCLFYVKYVRKDHFYNESLDSIRNRLGNVNYIKCTSFSELRRTLKGYDVIFSKNELLEAFIFDKIIGFNNVGPVIFSCVTSMNFAGVTSIQARIRNKLYSGSTYKHLCKEVSAFHTLNSSDSTVLNGLFPDKNIYKIYPSFNFEEFRQLSEKNRYDFKFDSAKFNIISVGRLSIQKGTEELIKLIDEINNTDLREKIVWNIVGKGEEGPKVEALAKRWNNINFLGYIENSYLPSILSNMNLYVSLSKIETFGYTIVEANTFDVPALSYNLSGPAELIEQEKNGYLANDYGEMKDALIKIVNKRMVFKNVTETIRGKLDASVIYPKVVKMFEEVSRKRSDKIDLSVYFSNNSENKLLTFDSNFSEDLKFSIEKWDYWYQEKLNSGTYKEDYAYYKKNYFPLTLEQLEQSKELTKDTVFLEIGSGEFFLGRLIADRVKLVVGIDLCPTALKIAKTMFDEAGIKNYLLIQGDILDMPLESNVIDLIYGGGTIEHFKDTQTCVNEIYRVLKPGGVSFNTVPLLNIGSLTYRQIWGNIPNFPVLRELAELLHIKLLGGKHMVFGYEYSFTPFHLKLLHRRAGFKKVEISKFAVHLKFEYIPSKFRQPFIWLSSNLSAFWPMIKAVGTK